MFSYRNYSLSLVNSLYYEKVFHIASAGGCNLQNAECDFCTFAQW
jgi:hypothetical protein